MTSSLASLPPRPLREREVRAVEESPDVDMAWPGLVAWGEMAPAGWESATYSLVVVTPDRWAALRFEADGWQPVAGDSRREGEGARKLAVVGVLALRETAGGEHGI